jgi:hypothetical protein
MERSWGSFTRSLLILLASAILSSCSQPEDPARVALRERLKQSAQLSADELTQFIGQIQRALTGKNVLVAQGGGPREMNDEQRAVVLGMLADPVGVFDEGMRTDGGRVRRVLNAPGKSLNEEVEAARKLWIDVDTFLPIRFEFVYGVPGYGDYGFDLAVKP